jgi:hypothetical protein
MYDAADRPKHASSFLDVLYQRPSGKQTKLTQKHSEALRSTQKHCWVIRFRGLKFSIYLFSVKTAPHGATSLHLAPTPHPTPWGGSPTPRRTLGMPIYGLGPTNGRIMPWEWVAKTGVLQ